MVLQVGQSGYSTTVQLYTPIASDVDDRIQSLSQDSLEHSTSTSGSLDLHRILRVKMQKVHLEAMKNEFLKDLQSGNMGCSKAYVVYLCNLHHLHAALERVQDRVDATFVFPELFRSAKLLNDIKIWSHFNDTDLQFSERETDSPEFLGNVNQYVQPCVRDFAIGLDKQNDSMAIVGTMFALYGTIMAGGQQVKEGVKKAFVKRLEEHLKEEDELGESRFKTRIIEAVLANPGAEKSVSLFSFDQEGFTMDDFKQKWHKALNDIPGAFDSRERIGDACIAGIRIVLDAISSLVKSKM